MSARASRYYGYPFQGSHGVNQGGPLCPRVFNFMVDVISYHCVVMVAENEAVPDVFGYTMTDNAAFFNGYDGFIASTNPVWLQWVFGVLIGMFE